MEAKTDRIYPSALLENIDLEQRLEEKQTMWIFPTIRLITLKKRFHTSKIKTINQKKYKNYETLITILEPVDSIVIIGAKSTSITLSNTGIGLIVLPISAGIACTLSLGNKILHKFIINKYNKYKKHYERDQNTIKFLIN